MLGNKKRYATLRSGYHHIMEQKYDDGIADFQIYLDLGSKIYWTIVEVFAKSKILSIEQKSLEVFTRAVRALN